MSVENALFCFGLALQIFAWVLSGAKMGFSPRKNVSVVNEQETTNKKKKW